MSGGLAGHLSLAVAGLIGGLPAAAALQWTRPIPAFVWWEAPPQQESPSAGWHTLDGRGKLATRPDGPRLTVVTHASALRPSSPGFGAVVRLRPSSLNLPAAFLGLTPRRTHRVFVPDGSAMDGRGAPSVAGGWRRGRIDWAMPTMVPVPRPPSGPK